MFCSSIAFGQTVDASGQSKEVVLNNNELKVVKFVSRPKGNVCGIGMHHHAPHLTVALTDAKVKITDSGGKSQEVTIKSGAAIWFEAETHAVINTGNKPTKFLLVYLKNQE